MEDKDSPIILKKIKDSLYEKTRQLFKIAFEDYGNLEISKEEETARRFTTIKEIEIEAKKSQVYNLQFITKFSPEELELIQLKFETSLPVNSSVQAIDFSAFEELIGTLIPNWKSLPEAVHAIWNKYNVEEKMDFGGLVSTLSVVQKGNLQERVKLYLELFSENNEITPKQLFKVVEAVVSLYDDSPKRTTIELFVSMLADKFMDGSETKENPKLSVDSL